MYFISVTHSVTEHGLLVLQHNHSVDIPLEWTYL